MQSAYLTKHAHPTLGLKPLAIMLSLPYGFLIWAVIAFVVAFLLLCFQSKPIWSQTSINLFVTVIVGLTIVRSILFFWNTERGIARQLIELRGRWNKIANKVKWWKDEDTLYDRESSGGPEDNV